jgi:serine/threonine protein phosphatase PrpC
VPHLTYYKLKEKIEYNLLMCTDGISNAIKIEDIVGIIENNDVCMIKIFKIVFYLIYCKK